MFRALIICLVLALPFMAFGQQDVVKVNILEIAGKIPPPPADVKDAYSRGVEVKEEGSSDTRHETEPYYKPVKEKMDATNNQIGKAIETLSKPQMDMAKQMNQEEMQKKFKSMSQEEQMKFAMEMSKKMGMGPKMMTPESKDVMAAQQECMKVNQSVGQDIENFQADHASREKLIKDRDAKHAEIETWKEEESKKLPQVSYGEMGGPEPKAEYALLVKVMNKHLAVENDYLKGVQKEYKALSDKYNARFVPVQDKLTKIHYGEDAKNPETRRQLLNGQSLMLSGMGEMLELSAKATEDAAGWWQRKLEMEKNKPKE